MKRTNRFIIIHLIISFVVIFSLHSCTVDDEIDKEKPAIDLSIANAFPLNCDTLYFGESFTFQVQFTDNMELGSYSIDIHHNFDHHSHTTEVSQCEMEEDKTPVNAFTFIEDYEIAKGLKSYKTSIEISLPASNIDGAFDQGDYHFFISLTDKEGWSAQKGLSVKILQR